MPYGTSEADALAALPAEITLNVKDGSEVKVTAAGWSWADGVTYSGTTAGNYTAATAFTVPSGYTYSGAKTVTAAVTVKALDMSKFDAALAAAEAKLSKFTVVNNAAEATDASKIYVVPNGTTADKVTKDVKFVLATDAAAYTALENAINKAKAAQLFASQATCDKLTTELTTAAANADNLISNPQTGTAYTNGYIKAQIKAWLDNGKADQNSKWAISDAAWPMKYDQEHNPTYQLPETTNEMQLSANTRGAVALTWTITGTGWKDYLKIETDSETGVKSVRVTKAPDAPMEIIFRVSAAGYGEIGTYTATIGAPISVSTTQPSDAPRFAPITPNNEGQVSGTSTAKINLNGAEAIKSVKIKDGDSNLITVSGFRPTQGGDPHISIIDSGVESVAIDTTGLELTISITTGTVGGVWSPNNNTTPAYSPGKLKDIELRRTPTTQ